MNKNMLVVIVIFVLMSAIGFSGCIQSDNNANNIGNKVEIINWYNGTYIAVDDLLANGFVYDEQAKLYIVNGTAKNNADRQIKTVIIHVKYYDINNNLLWEDSLLENGIPPGETWPFWSFYTKDQEHFEIVHHVEFDISGQLME